MNQSRCFSSFLFVGLVLLYYPSAICNLVEPHDAFDDLIAFADSDVGGQLLDDTTFLITRTASKGAVITLLSELGFFPLLQQNFFLRSNILRSRSLLDYPEFIPWRHDKDKRAVYIDLFFNETPRMFFNKESSNICSYLAVASPSFLAIIDNIFDNLRALLNESPIQKDKLFRLLDLFKTFTVQERRFGLMIGGKTKFDFWHFHIMAPWYYLERNHFVDQQVANDIESLVNDIFGSPSTPEQAAQALNRRHTFEDNYLISDKMGIGDTRIYCDYPIIKNKYLSTRLGFLATIPTAFAMKKGLKGSHFNLVQFPPTLDLQELITLATSANGQPFTDPQALNYALTILSNFSAMVLESPLGNGGHFGLGIYARNRSPLSLFIRQDWARRIYMRSFISLEYLFPATEFRSFRVPVQEALFNQRNLSFVGDADSAEDQAIVNSNYEFILQQLNDRLFPSVFQATIHPGFIFRWSSQLIYEGNYCGFSFGTDTYVRNKESFSNIDAVGVTKNTLDIDTARSPLSYQSKICASVFWKIEKPCRLWTVGLIGDYTFMNKGIGADFTLALKVNVAF
jgi:hypothetical protein